jgi:hypothetical protein
VQTVSKFDICPLEYGGYNQAHNPDAKFWVMERALASSPQRLSPSVPLIYDLCTPRADVLKGTTDSDFAADLAKVIRGVASAEYQQPRSFLPIPTRLGVSRTCGRTSVPA